MTDRAGFVEVDKGGPETPSQKLGDAVAQSAHAYCHGCMNTPTRVRCSTRPTLPLTVVPVNTPRALAHVRAHMQARTTSRARARARPREATAHAQVTKKLNQLGKHAIGDHQLQMTLLQLKHIKATILLQVFVQPEPDERPFFSVAWLGERWGEGAGHSGWSKTVVWRAGID